MGDENGASMMQIDARLEALERWRDAVDDERGTIMRELGEFKGLLTGVRDQIRDQTTAMSRELSVQMQLVNGRLDGIEDKLDERPSQVELQKLESQLSRSVESIRAKTRPKLSEIEIRLSKDRSIKLFGFSGLTIVVTTLLLVTLAALWLVTKK